VENLGASADQVDKQGGWAPKSRNGAYANHTVPWEAVRVLAGFGPEQARYYIPRSILQPPNELISLVLPKFDAALKELSSHPTQWI
jgi:hypothetical protein